MACQPVFLESESKRIGSVAIPECLWHRMIAAPVVAIRVPVSERARFLVDEYAHFVSDPAQLLAKLPALKRMHGGSLVAEWETLAKRQPPFTEDQVYVASGGMNAH